MLLEAPANGGGPHDVNPATIVVFKKQVVAH